MYVLMSFHHIFIYYVEWKSHCGAHIISGILQVYMKQFFFYFTVFRLKNEKKKFVEK